jgi:hypothetical protein
VEEKIRMHLKNSGDKLFAEALTGVNAYVLTHFIDAFARRST